MKLKIKLSIILLHGNRNVCALENATALPISIRCSDVFLNYSFDFLSEDVLCVVADAFLFVEHYFNLLILFCCFPFAVYLQSLSSRLSQISAAFDPSRSKNTSDACKRHTRQFINALHRFDLWAFQSNLLFCVLFF